MVLILNDDHRNDNTFMQLMMVLKMLVILESVMFRWNDGYSSVMNNDSDKNKWLFYKIMSILQNQVHSELSPFYRIDFILSNGVIRNGPDSRE